MNNMTLFWLVLCIVMTVVELVTVAMVSIWFAGGAGAALIASLLGAGSEIQWLVFAVVSLLLLIIFRKKMTSCFNKKRTPTNTDRIIGMRVRVIEAVDNSKDLGIVEVNGQEWTARGIEEEDIIEVGTHVTVERMEGNKLYVKR